MNNLDINDLAKKVDHVESRVDELKQQISNRHEEAKAIKTSPSEFLQPVFEKLWPLAKSVADDGDVSNAEMASKEQNHALKALLEPVMASFKDAKIRFDEVDGKLGGWLEQANEADTALEELAVQLAEYKPFVANRKEAEERYLADAKEKEVRYMAERDQLKVRERELEARRQDNESVVHPKREEGFMGWVKEIGWGLALTSRDPYNPYVMNDAEMLLESCRQDLEVVQELMKSNNRSLENAKENIKTYSERVERAQEALRTIDTINEDIGKTLSDERAASTQARQDIDYLRGQRKGMEKMQQSLSNASAEGVAGLRIAYRKRFAEAILKVLKATPTDDGLLSQMEKILHTLQTMPSDSQLYGELQPTFRSVEDRIKARRAGDLTV